MALRFIGFLLMSLCASLVLAEHYLLATIFGIAALWVVTEIMIRSAEEYTLD